MSNPNGPIDNSGLYAGNYIDGSKAYFGTTHSPSCVQRVYTRVTTSTNYRGPGAYAQKCPPSNPLQYLTYNITGIKYHPKIVWSEIDLNTYVTITGSTFGVKLHVTLQNGTEYDDVALVYRHTDDVNYIRYIAVDGNALNATFFIFECT